MTLEPVAAAVPRVKTEYVCPMHPEVVRDAPGVCPKCGMALEPRAVSLRLKDGSMLSMDSAGGMMMNDAHGMHMEMKDDEIMETADGRTLMMKNNALWQRMPRSMLNPNAQ